MTEIARLEGATVLVTGGSNETGAFICRAMAEAGANVALTWHDDEAAARAVAADVETAGGFAETYRLDLLEQQSIDDLVAALRRDWKRIDVAVLCAGTVGLRSFRELTRDQLDVAVDGNLKGNFMLGKGIGYWMQETGGLGRQIHFSAQGAENPSHSAYGLAKAALEVATRQLAWFLAPSVTVNTLQPTSIDQDPDHEVGEPLESLLGRKVHARELARMCMLLCDPAFDSVTGEVIRLDGGRHIMPAFDKDL